MEYAAQSGRADEAQVAEGGERVVSIPSASEFLSIVQTPVNVVTFSLGRIDPAYSGSGNPKVIFDGETSVSGKTYPFLASYTPVANDRVLIAKIGQSCIILGKFDGTKALAKLDLLTVTSARNLDILYGTGTPIPGTTGTLTVTMDSSIKTITPTGACTFNASGGVTGQRCTFIITTSGTTSYTLAWSTNFKPAGTLSTGTTSGKVYAVNFVYNGSLWVETGRTGAM